MANHNLPTQTSTYINFVSELDGRFDDLCYGLDPARTTMANLPTNSVGWSSELSKWRKWTGSTWTDLTTNNTYSINISGNAATASSLNNALTFGANLLGTSFNGSTAVTISVDAASTNTASKIVIRDASGNFAANAVTLSNLSTTSITASGTSSLTTISSTTITATTVNATDVNTTSDITLKKNITEIDGLDLVRLIEVFSFDWIDTNKKSYGVLAQHFEKNFPELVSTNENGIKSVSYIPIIAILVDAVKKLDSKIKDLESK